MKLSVYQIRKPLDLANLQQKSFTEGKTLAMKAYVLIETEVGKASEVAEAVQKVEGVKSADTVTDSQDVVAAIEVADIDALGTVVKQIHSVAGIGKTTTCIGVKYS